MKPCRNGHASERYTKGANRGKCKECCRNKAVRNKLARDKANLRHLNSNCDACGKFFADGLHWDHDHATGNFRGWLCRHCNTVLGNAGDDPTLLRQLAAYLERSPDGWML